MFIYQLNARQTIGAGQWEIGCQFSFNGQVRNTSNDTYTIWTGPYEIISGHF
jgi:hypothetical protein